MENLYIAYADTGRDFIDFEFYSEHRSGSKSNIEDAVREYERKHGRKVKIIDTWRA